MKNQNKVSRKSTLSDETIAALRELGEVLREIHYDLIKQGYVMKDGKLVKPEEYFDSDIR